MEEVDKICNYYLKHAFTDERGVEARVEETPSFHFLVEDDPHITLNLCFFHKTLIL